MAHTANFTTIFREQATQCGAAMPIPVDDTMREMLGLLQQQTQSSWLSAFSSAVSALAVLTALGAPLLLEWVGRKKKAKLEKAKAEMDALQKRTETLDHNLQREREWRLVLENRVLVLEGVARK
ncbi:hypothetical protein JX265_004176 [Neoarthrinium moseri]|uniref:Uncharacterized protein n=1 Tax=Neoarthrinium moseri TaxID=1658444 RepID=A0A9Q0AP58_9PEZI|nr:hypothetical protein JX265_004176 [Neoarthrinium moseri]